MRTRLLLPLAATLLLLAAPAAGAAGWSTVPLPRHSGLNAITCLSTSWCEAVGAWDNRLQAGHWNGHRWSVQTILPHTRYANVAGLTCRSRNSCIAVGQQFLYGRYPALPFAMSWNGRTWAVQRVPVPSEPTGFHHEATAHLTSVACPGAGRCFGVGQEAPRGQGNTPGAALIERWTGSRWYVMGNPRGSSQLNSISCTSARACTAVGGFEHQTGTAGANNEQIEYPTTVEHWNGHRWTLGSFTTSGSQGLAGLLGVSCAGGSFCMAVGNQASQLKPDGTTTGADQSLAARGDGATFAGTPIPYPPTVYRGGTGSPATVLFAVSCQTSASCAAVGRYQADNGALGPLAAFWNGTTWSEVALRRGPVELSAVSCPALGWCMAVGGGIAERFIG